MINVSYGRFFELPYGETLSSDNAYDLFTPLYHAAWADLHNKQDATPEWLDDWAKRLPNNGCGCLESFHRLIETLPPRYGPDWFRWTYELRNAVRAKLGKIPAVWDWGRALREWSPQQAKIDSVIAVTSLGPGNAERQHAALASWKRLGLSIVSVNTNQEIESLCDEFPEVDQWEPNEELGTFYDKPTQPINRLLNVALTRNSPILLINSDIQTLGDQRTILDVVEAGKSAIGIRHNFEAGKLEKAKQETWGLDAFLVYPDQAATLSKVHYSIGRPMWDYWLAWELERRYNRETLWIGEPFFFHPSHPVAWTEEDCKKGHEDFVRKFEPMNWTEWRSSRPFWNG